MHLKLVTISVHLREEKKQISLIFSGIVGDIELNKQPLRDFTIYSLDMKPAFVNRFVSYNYHPVSLYVCESLSLHFPCLYALQTILFLFLTITKEIEKRKAIKSPHAYANITIS